MKQGEIRYYDSVTDDFEQTAAQDFVLPPDYRWVRTDVVSRLLSAGIYAAAVAFSTVYCRAVLHMRVHGRKAARGLKGEFFLYGNHTQPLGDVFIPALCVLPRRIYTVVSTANYGIPVIGRILPYLGALPIDNSVHGLKELQRAMETRLAQHHPIVIYPEAHVWEYYTDIRPFPDTAFRFPVKMEKPCVAMTVTYRKSRLFRRPIMDVYLDGPFYPRGASLKEKTADLHDQVYAAMKERSANSNYAYIEYRKR